MNCELLEKDGLKSFEVQLETEFLQPNNGSEKCLEKLSSYSKAHKKYDFLSKWTG